MFVIHRRGCRPLASSADLIAVRRLGALTYVEYAHPGHPASTVASTEIVRVEVIIEPES